MLIDVFVAHIFFLCSSICRITLVFVSFIHLVGLITQLAYGFLTFRGEVLCIMCNRWPCFLCSANFELVSLLKSHVVTDHSVTHAQYAAWRQFITGTCSECGVFILNFPWTISLLLGLLRFVLPFSQPESRLIFRRSFARSRRFSGHGDDSLGYLL